ncbi:hypothetical protein CVT26_014991 [Gymnopilus dilepis]|uniref:Cation/H+ exchanger transmembrane domain-containing protein n=1 Tax=Gymnopilus dilepis TaxID=231916 RepID=A0A409YXS2_9AGAR|nr:hypothetical protein CVT26_014991 [Gymnopilus dilepis]
MSTSIATALPNHSQRPYAQPDIPNLLALGSYLYLLSCTSSLAGTIVNAPLLGPLITAILLGPNLAGLLTPATQDISINLGYIGLILIVFEAGLTTNIPLLISNAALSTVTALTGVCLPIALSMAIFKGAWGYGSLQAFAAGASLCSTSLGTTIALLTPDLRTTKVGSVLMAAALLDDVIGLVVAGIISGLAGANSGVTWEEIVRPVLVSLAFGLGTPVMAVLLKKALRTTLILLSRRVSTRQPSASSTFHRKDRIYLLITVITLSAFVAGASYAGTSDLFGAYLAGTFLSYVFTSETNDPASEATDSPSNAAPSSPVLKAFENYLEPILRPLLEPIFFASIGSSIPVKSLFTTYLRDSSSAKGGVYASHRVVWRGLLYALLMTIGKMCVGFWFFVWPRPGFCSRAAVRLSRFLKKQVQSRTRGALLLGIAMVARGEIALIVAQLARPLLLGSGLADEGSNIVDEEPAAIVMWAILITTLAGAVGVGILLKAWQRRDDNRVTRESNPTQG